MTTPTELLLKMMPPAVAAGKKALDKANRVGGAVNRAQNPLTPAIIAAPAVKKGLETAGGVLNNKVISQQLDDPLVKGLAAKHPFTGLLLGATGIARGFNSQSKVGEQKPTSGKTETKKPVVKDIDTSAPTGVTATRRPTTFELSQKIRDENPDSYETVELPAAAKPPSKSNSTGRDAPDPARTGAKGTNTGYKIDLSIAEESLGRKIADINSFLSEELPVVGYKDQSGREIRPTGGDLSELQGSYADGLISKDDLIFEGVSAPNKKGVSAADSADNKRAVRMPGDMDDMDPMFEATGGADDDDFGGPDPEDYATNYSARRKAQRDAFLNPNITNSIDAINASNSAIGVAVRGGKYYANDGGTLREIHKDAYDKQRSTGLTSEELKGSYVDKIKATLVPVTQSNVFSDDTDLGPISEGVTYNSPVDMGTIAQTEFDMNNVAPGFSASDRAGMKADYFSDVDYDIDDDKD